MSRHLHHRARACLLAVTTTFLALLTAGCTGGPSPQPTPSAAPAITLGDTVDAGTSVLDAGHGSVTVDNVDSPLQGLCLTVPDGAYAQAVSVAITYRAITGYDLPAGARPVSPLIRIDAGDAAPDEYLVIELPLALAEGEFAMMFTYDAEANLFEPLPLLESTTAVVAVGGRGFHRAAAAAHRATGSRKAGAGESDGVVAIAFAQAALDSANVDTLFRPGTDTWQIANLGSFPQPEGFCSGMVITELWYYLERRLAGEPALWDRYDNYSLGLERQTRGFLLDDDLPIKLCTAVQPFLLIAETRYFDMLEHRGALLTVPQQHFYATVAAMVVNREEHHPQYLSLATANDRTRHAVLCTRVVGHDLYIADPNWPSAERVLRFNGQTFDAYPSGLNATEAQSSPNSYTTVRLVGGRDAVLTWNQVGALFGELESGALGMNAGEFPAASVRIAELDDQGGVVDTYVADPLLGNDVSRPRIRVELDDAGFEGKMSIYRFGAPPTELTDSVIDLQPGENLLGFYIEGFTSYPVTGEDGQTDQRTCWRWVAFPWISLDYAPASTKPTVTIQAPTADQSFTVGDPVVLQATATDAAGQPIPGERVAWTSNLDGTLGTGLALTVTTLSVGSHTLTVTATDADSNTGTAKVNITIVEGHTPPADCPIPDGATFHISGLAEYYWLEVIGQVGLLQNWNADHTALIHESCRNALGQFHGWFRNWDADGTLTAEIQYAEGRYHGVFREFDGSNGTMIREDYYTAGQFDGLSRAWYATNGQLQREIHYVAGKYDGSYRTWFENGQMQHDTAYVDGLEHGTLRQWNESGALLWTCTYDHGTAVECH